MQEQAEIVAVKDPATFTEQELIAAIKLSIDVSVSAAIDAGELLLEAKKRHGKHGEWIAWLTVKVHVSVRTAQRYMRLAKASKNDRLAYLEAEGVSAALRMADAQWTKRAARLYCCPNCGWNGCQRVVRHFESKRPAEHVEQVQR